MSLCGINTFISLSLQDTDRTPSQFYRDLKKLATPPISDDLVLTLWKNCLPVNTQWVLAVIRKASADALASVVEDRIHEISPETEQIAADSGQLVSERRVWLLADRAIPRVETHTGGASRC